MRTVLQFLLHQRKIGTHVFLLQFINKQGQTIWDKNERNCVYVCVCVCERERDLFPLTRLDREAAALLIAPVSVIGLWRVKRLWRIKRKKKKNVLRKTRSTNGPHSYVHCWKNSCFLRWAFDHVANIYFKPNCNMLHLFSISDVKFYNKSNMQCMENECIKCKHQLHLEMSFWNVIDLLI